MGHFATWAWTANWECVPRRARAEAWWTSQAASDDSSQVKFSCRASENAYRTFCNDIRKCIEDIQLFYRMEKGNQNFRWKFPVNVGFLSGPGTDIQVYWTNELKNTLRYKGDIDIKIKETISDILKPTEAVTIIIIPKRIPWKTANIFQCFGLSLTPMTSSAYSLWLFILCWNWI